MMELDLPLERLDGGGGLPLAWDHGEHVGDRAPRVGRRHVLVGKAAMDGLDTLGRNRLPNSRAITAPAPATPALIATAAMTPSGALRSKAAETQAAASTASQPTKNTATLASPNVITPSRRRTGGGAATTTARSVGVTGSVRSVAITCGPMGRGRAIWSVASTSITRAVIGARRSD